MVRPDDRAAEFDGITQLITIMDMPRHAALLVALDDQLEDLGTARHRDRRVEPFHRLAIDLGDNLDGIARKVLERDTGRHGENEGCRVGGQQVFLEQLAVKDRRIHGKVLS
jgi:hypothetical protein